MTAAPLDFSTVAAALPAFAFGLASRIGYEAFGILHADMAGKPLDLGRVRELLGEKQAAIVNRWAGRRRDVVFPACPRAVLWHATRAALSLPVLKGGASRAFR